MHSSIHKSGLAVFTVVLSSLVGCASTSPIPPLAPVALASKVDLRRFMGDWYVIANIPTVFERGANNAKDTYRLDTDGTILTTYSYNADTPDGPMKTLDSRGFVIDETSNAVWGQQYVWPIKADYRIAFVSADYTQMVIAREKRDYVWIMARTPRIAEADYSKLVAFVSSQGYDASKLQLAPQRPLPATTP